MIAIAVSDLHIDRYASQSNGRDRLEDCLRVIDDVYRLAIKKDAKVILMTGDFYNTITFLFTVVMTRTLERMDKWVNKCPDIVWYGITGNHDFATQNLPHAPAVSALEHLQITFPDNFVLLDNSIHIFAKEKVTVCGIPNYKYKEHFHSKLEEMSEAVSDMGRRGFKLILMIHQKPSGNSNPTITVDTDVNDPLYDIFDLVLCGDIHTRQIITDKFVLVGNPLHRELCDAGQEKGIWSLDLTDPVDTLKFHSRVGRYPEFIRLQEGDDTEVDEENNFVIRDPKPISLNLAKGSADLDTYSSTLPKATIMKNFWKEQGKGDKDLLRTGIKFIS